MPFLGHKVALRKESVDRNHYCAGCASGNPTSLSARRAWIEMPFLGHKNPRELSLSARRAWIEIAGQPAHGLPSIVALRKESVDRNAGQPAHGLPSIGRSPQGERG